MTKRLWFFCWLCCFGAVAAPVKTMHISYVDHPASYPFMQLIKQSYAELGYKVVFENMPLSRRLQMLNEGELDADVGARQEVTETYPNLLRVGPPLLKSDVTLYCQKDLVCDASALNNPYQTLYTDPQLWEFLRLYSPSIQIQPQMINDIASLTALFSKGRAPYIAIAVMDSKKQNVLLPQADHSIISQMVFYHHISQKHAALAPALADTLAKKLDEYRKSPEKAALIH